MQSDTDEEHATLCIPCLNWKRRTMRRSRKVYLQIDQMICYILQPGRMNEPDQRCVQRLLKALADDGNPLSSSAPMPVKTIVAKLAARFRDKNVANIDMVRIGGLLADMMPGARVPVGLKVTGLTLEDFINQGREAETGETHGTVQASESIESGDSPPSARTH